MRPAEYGAGRARRRWSWRARLLGGAVASLGLFAALAVTIATGGRGPFDQLFFRQLYSGESDWHLGHTPGQDSAVLQHLTPLLYRVADARKLALLVGVVLAVLLARRLFRGALFYAAAVSIVALSPLLKDAFGRPSPFPVPGDPSFPSGHAMGSMALASGGVVLLARTRWRWLAVAAALLLLGAVGVAVIADGGHWPSDVAAGWLLALAWVLALAAVFGDPLQSNSRLFSRPRPAVE